MTRLSPEDSALDAWLLCKHRKRLPYIERAIASLPDDDLNKSELQKYMRWFRDSLASGNQFQTTIASHLLVVGVKAATHTIPLALTGESHKEEQRKRASNPRGGIGTTIKKLAQRKDALGDWITPKELWGELFAILDESFGARERATEKKDLEISYTTEGGLLKTIKLSSFQVSISKYRNKS